jgi:hypothetical protein
LAVGQGFATSNDVYWNQMMAASLLVSVPIVAGFLALQRHFLSGLTAGAMKSAGPSTSGETDLGSTCDERRTGSGG